MPADTRCWTTQRYEEATTTKAESLLIEPSHQDYQAETGKREVGELKPESGQGCWWGCRDARRYSSPELPHSFQPLIDAPEWPNLAIKQLARDHEKD